MNSYLLSFIVFMIHVREGLNDNFYNKYFFFFLVLLIIYLADEK